MGSKCCLPEESFLQDIENYNNKLRNLIVQVLRKHKAKSELTERIDNYIKTGNDQHLFRLEYDVDIDQLVGSTNSNDKLISTITRDDDFSKTLAASCLIPEDEVESASNQTTENQINSFSLKMEKNASLMMQFDTIFKPFIEDGPYKESIRIFLNWVTIAQKHFQNGFLRPLYNEMWNYAKKLMNEIQTKDPELLMTKLYLQVSVFVRCMFQVYCSVYKIEDICRSDKGKIFKQENINHFVICRLFSNQKFTKTLSDQLMNREREYIQGFEMRLNLLEGQSFDYFNIPPKFQLISRNSILTESKSITSVNSYQSAVNTLKKIISSKTPISKLKILLQVQKQIVKQIQSHYKELEQPIPEIDSDTITSLSMFVVVKSKVKELPVELRIVETFSSKNAMNSISGYYVSTFNMVISMIDAFQGQPNQ